MGGNGSTNEAWAAADLFNGRVKWFNNQKGYGFIVRGDDPDIFVHHTAIRMEGYRTLKQGEEVRFELVTTDKGLQAVNVSRLEGQQEEETVPDEPRRATA